MNLKDIVSQKVYTLPLNEMYLNEKCIINTINPHSYCVAKKDSLFAKALLQSDVLLPDGSGIVLATKLLTGKKIKKIAGADIHQYLLEQANDKSQRVFYLGSSQNTLNSIEERILKEFPNIKVASYSPPFKPQFSEKETSAMISVVNAFQPHYLFVGMTAPKQEKWVCAHTNRLDVKVIASIGAVFDFYAGNINRAPNWMINFGIEWLHRSLKSRRLLIRNLKSNPIFLYDIIKEKLK